MCASRVGASQRSSQLYLKPVCIQSQRHLQHFAWFQACARQGGLLQQTAGASEAALFLPLRFLLLDVTLCHGHSRYVALSISIGAAPLGLGGKRRDVQTLFACEHGCLCIKESCAHADSTCARSARVLVYVLLVFVCFSRLLRHRHLSVCCLAKPKAPVGFWGLREEKKRFHSFFHPLKHVPLLPVLSFFQDICEGFFSLFADDVLVRQEALLVHTVVTSRLDECYLLLAGCPNDSLRSLQLIHESSGSN